MLTTPIDHSISYRNVPQCYGTIIGARDQQILLKWQESYDLESRSLGTLQIEISDLQLASNVVQHYLADIWSWAHQVVNGIPMNTIHLTEVALQCVQQPLLLQVPYANHAILTPRSQVLTILCERDGLDRFVTSWFVLQSQQNLCLAWVRQRYYAIITTTANYLVVVVPYGAVYVRFVRVETYQGIGWQLLMNDYHFTTGNQIAHLYFQI